MAKFTAGTLLPTERGVDVEEGVAAGPGVAAEEGEEPGAGVPTGLKPGVGLLEALSADWARTGVDRVASRRAVAAALRGWGIKKRINCNEVHELWCEYVSLSGLRRGE